MELQDIKLLGLNTFSLTVSFTDIETILKIILLIVSIGYTINRWYDISKKNNS